MKHLSKVLFATAVVSSLAGGAAFGQTAAGPQGIENANLGPYNQAATADVATGDEGGPGLVNANIGPYSTVPSGVSENVVSEPSTSSASALANAGLGPYDKSATTSTDGGPGIINANLGPYGDK